MNLSKAFVLPFILLFIGCGSDGSGKPSSNPPPEAIGTWVGKLDIESLNNLINSDGTCKEVYMSSPSDLGNFYLQAFKIEPTGAFRELSTISINSSDSGDFIDKGQIQSDGKFTFNPNLLKLMAKQGIIYKSYDHSVSVSGDVLLYTIKNQQIIFEGKTWDMNNSNDEYIRKTESEFLKYVAQAKSCTKNQKLVP